MNLASEVSVRKILKVIYRNNREMYTIQFASFIIKPLRSHMKLFANPTHTCVCIHFKIYILVVVQFFFRTSFLLPNCLESTFPI